MRVRSEVKERETEGTGLGKRRCASLALVLALVAGQALAADDPVQRAMKSYEKHRYEEAAQGIRAALPSLAPGKQSQAQLVLGMIYLRNALLHRRLADLSAAVNREYLKRLSRQRGSGRSRYSTLYQGLAELAADRYDRAEAVLGPFAAATKDARAAALARIAQGRAAAGRGDRQKAAALWAGIPAKGPEVLAELADALSTGGVRDRDPSALCDTALADTQRGGKTPSIDVVKGCLGVYARAGLVDRGAGLLERADLKDHSFRETRGKSKELFFYDVRLLSNLSTFYLTAGLAALEKAADDPQARGTANYYLGEAHLLAGNGEAAAKATAVFLAEPRTPMPYRNRALVRQAEILYRKGKRSEAIGTWDDLTRNQPKDPDLLADIVSTCGGLGIDCPRPLQAAAVLSETGEGKRFVGVNAGLGMYHLGRKDAARALTYLEAGRDKGNKNKIEFNDPELLTALADAYYRTKKYSEALEIFFEMSKQFPQVRQIQEALQGIYSMEHKSAGDVKIN